MTRKKVSWKALLVPAAVLAAVIPLRAADGRGSHGRNETLREDRIAECLALSADQQASWKTLRERYDSEVEPLRSEARELHRQLKAEMDAENPDPAAVGVATLALKAQGQKMKASREAFEGRVEALLSDDQKAKLEAFKESAGCHRSHGGYRHRSHGSDETSGSQPQDGDVES